MKYFYKENAFNDNTEECYYFLGFIFADGCASDKGEIRINLNIKDEEILKNFKNYLQTEKPIFYYNKTNSCALSFGNKKILNTMMSFGLTPRKSLTLKFPNGIPQNMVCHFIRGYFDGDGCVSILKGKNTLRLRINLVGTLEFLSELQNILIKELGINKTEITNITSGKNVYQLNIKNNTDIKKIKKFFYENSTTYLRRKKIIFDTEVDMKILSNTTTSKYKNILYRKKGKSWSILYKLDGKRIEKPGFKSEKDAYAFLTKIKMG
jgi:hypothetical protein